MLLLINWRHLSLASALIEQTLFGVAWFCIPPSSPLFRDFTLQTLGQSQFLALLHLNFYDVLLWLNISAMHSLLVTSDARNIIFLVHYLSHGLNKVPFNNQTTFNH